MVYLDTNVLIYAAVEQGVERKAHCIDLIESLYCQNKLLLSVLSLQELGYTMAKLGVVTQTIRGDILFYNQFVKHDITAELFASAFEIAVKTSKLKSLGDAMHVEYAQRYAAKLITFDKDFNRFKEHTSIVIDILS